MTSDVQWYYQVAMRDYPDLIATHEHTINREQIIAETVFFYVHNRLPEWATELEQVESVKNHATGEVSYIFIQRDHSKAQ